MRAAERGEITSQEVITYIYHWIYGGNNWWCS
jgi:hypothetical protein